MLTTLMCWVLGIFVAIVVVSVAIVARFVLYGIGLIVIIIIIGGVVATGFKEAYRSKDK